MLSMRRHDKQVVAGLITFLRLSFAFGLHAWLPHRSFSSSSYSVSLISIVGQSSAVLLTATFPFALFTHGLTKLLPRFRCLRRLHVTLFFLANLVVLLGQCGL